MAVSTVQFPGLSQFGELRTVEKTPLVELASTFPLSVLRDVSTVAGSATITTTGGEHRLQTTASGTDAATLDSAEKGRYKPGYSAEAGIGVRIPTLPTGSQEAIWGYADDNNGVYFGVDATGVFVARKSNGTETKVRQADWNADVLDGTGASALTLDLSRGNIFQIVFSWYGYGVIEFQVVQVDAVGRQKVITVHRTEVDGSVSIQEPNLPVRAKISNGGTATAFNLYVGGRQFSVIGRYIPNERRTSARRLLLGSIGTTALPLVTVRRKSAFLDVPIRIAGIDAITTGDALLEVYLDTALTGASYGTPENVSASETALERDVSATALSGGNVIYSTLISSGGTGNNRSGAAGIGGLSIGIPLQQPVTIAVSALSGTITASAVLRILEDW